MYISCYTSQNIRHIINSVLLALVKPLSPWRWPHHNHQPTGATSSRWRWGPHWEPRTRGKLWALATSLDCSWLWSSPSSSNKLWMRQRCLTSSETGLKCPQRTPLSRSSVLLSPIWSSRATSCLLIRDFPNNRSPVLLACQVQTVSWNWTFNKSKATHPRSRALWSPAAIWTSWGLLYMVSFDAASAACPVTMALCQWGCFRRF